MFSAILNREVLSKEKVRVDWWFWNTVFCILICSSSIWSSLRNPVASYKRKSSSISVSSAFHFSFCFEENRLSYCRNPLCGSLFILCTSHVSVPVPSPGVFLSAKVENTPLGEDLSVPPRLSVRRSGSLPAMSAGGLRTGYCAALPTP